MAKRNLKKLALVECDFDGGFYVESPNFIPQEYEAETFGAEETYIDRVLFTGTLNEIICFLRAYVYHSTFEWCEDAQRASAYSNRIFKDFYARVLKHKEPAQVYGSEGGEQI